MHTQYCHDKLTAIYGSNYGEALSARTPINPYLKEAIDKAFSESRNKTEFKQATKKYAKLTASGIKECYYCQDLLTKFK